MGGTEGLGTQGSSMKKTQPAESLRVEQVPIDSLHLDPANVRSHGPRNLEAIQASLARFGQQKPIVALKTSSSPERPPASPLSLPSRRRTALPSRAPDCRPRPSRWGVRRKRLRAAYAPEHRCRRPRACGSRLGRAGRSPHPRRRPCGWPSSYPLRAMPAPYRSSRRTRSRRRGSKRGSRRDCAETPRPP